LVSLSPEKAAAHFGWLAMFAGADLVASSEKTRKNLGWNPTGPELIGDLQRIDTPKLHKRYVLDQILTAATFGIRERRRPGGNRFATNLLS
jgi:hypothetical protein